MPRPDGGMFSIKLIHPNHLKYAYFTDDFDGTDGRWPLMNFTGDDRGRSIAARLPIGHRSLVYVIHHQRFVWAVEYTGTLEEGERAAAAHGITPNDITSKWNTYRPIRFLARVDLADAPTAEDIFKRTGIRFKANAFTLKYISAGEYQTIYDAINWRKTPRPVPGGSEKEVGLTPPLPAKPVTFDLPPVPNAESLRARIREVQGLPERNMEDVVKSFLVVLGHPETCVRFQVGHVDVGVEDGQGKTRIVVEVKRSLLVEKAWRDARRKGFDYASEVGSPLVVVTDADIYEVYDRSGGHDYDSMLCGRFQLTKFTQADSEVLNRLRPETKTGVDDQGQPTAAQIEAVLKHLPILTKPNPSVSQWHSSERKDGVIEMPREEHSAEISQLLSDLYENCFVVDFDWPSWETSARGYVEDAERLKTASLDTLQRLLTTHVRKDKFCEGHFSEMVRCGHIRAILERLAALHGGNENE
jgi:hypothetical protein